VKLSQRRDNSMSLRRPRRVAIFVSLGAVLGVAALWGWGVPDGQTESPGLGRASGTDPSTSPIPEDLTGSALAEALGLKLQSSFTTGCAHYVEVEESGAGYCLDASVTSNLEAWDVGNRLRELERSDLDRRIFILADQIAQASEAGDTETVERLSAEVQILVEEKYNQASQP
jgi:hypothetical protein